MIDAGLNSVDKIPSSLCRWNIQYRRIHYDELPSPPHFPTNNLILDDEKNWPKWPSSAASREYIEKLSDSLKSNNFSSVKFDELPISVDHVARAVRHSPKELFEEALGFSIMSRNLDLFIDLLEKNEEGDQFDVAMLYPFHLAVTYLDGSKMCCRILELLEEMLPRYLRKLYVNELGHKILD